jgi:hypothetical protein
MTTTAVICRVLITVQLLAGGASNPAAQSGVPGLKGPITQGPNDSYNIPGFDTPHWQCARPHTSYGRQQLESWLRYCVAIYRQTKAAQTEWDSLPKRTEIPR